MTDKLIKLIELFREHGGRFENMTIGYRQESGYYCSVIDSSRDATVFCPAHLLVDIDDIGISEAGLFIARPENYADNIGFLEKYFSYHFNERMVSRLLDDKHQRDSLSEQEKSLLKKIGLPIIIDGTDEKLEYVRRWALQAHQIEFGPLKSKVIMPFISLVNHHMDGAPFGFNKDGITVSGKFDGEVFAIYNMNDTLMFLGNYGFVTETEYAYSLSMKIKYSDEVTLQINRDLTKFTTIDGDRWPVIEKQDGVITASWFPMYYRNSPTYPARVAASLSRAADIPAENIIHSVFRGNLNALLSIVFALKDSRNRYVQMAVSGVEQQLELIGKIQ